MTDDEIRARLGFDTMPDDVRNRWSPISPFSITRSVRQGVAGYEVMDMRTSKRVRVSTKREATHVAKMIEAHFYGKKG